ncbi:hypothetical protein LPN01_07235 [Sphingomonas sp. A2-49]|uniref:hypothetical protein n=1 Tax=Sphingomonas sp. A2-49 TaxID=1391375 RepID=UPI0021D00EFB|nr:hypothetical protein [Sphingomonas sp. A2-49]MCU6453868.1 hypothetical protein [Sphingomonas sp. A2-49]
MNPAEMIIIVVALIVIGVVLSLRHVRAGRDAPPPATAEDTWRLALEVQQLKERIQVLERVITDTRGPADLDREIERLRDR